MEFYRATSLVNQFIHNHRRYNGVKLHWFANRQYPIIAYRKVVRDFDMLSEKDKNFTKEFVKEFLTMREAEQLRQYLTMAHKWSVEISPYQFPVEGNQLAFKAHEIGDTKGFIKLNEEQNFNMRVHVWGYFDLTDLEPIGGFVNTISEWMDRTRKRLTGLVDRLSSSDKATV